ncbi:protein dpy-30 homolog isoform X2 [Adelges cooleyi]|uniref:protein dpy-30 homolog isoform X2 n=1 Tax=Adelges cooleyi TaxID=133065 RepID=UPI00217FB4A8|nr:protein dpy-30 homolog isoform X2 [Adelges cooleyi]
MSSSEATNGQVPTTPPLVHPSDVSSESSLMESQKDVNAKKTKKDSKHVAPMRQYLDQTVVPALLVGMKELVKERPPDPLGYLAAFLLKYKKEHVDKDSNSETQ